VFFVDMILISFVFVKGVHRKIAIIEADYSFTEKTTYCIVRYDKETSGFIT